MRREVAESPTPRSRLWILTATALIAFAANSMLCRAALREGHVDAASFTLVRLLTGAVAMSVLARLSPSSTRSAGNWTSAFALFVYAAAFSFAYLALPAGIGALLLFGTVQLTMIGAGLFMRERLGILQWTGLLLAMAGLCGLLVPGSSAPSTGACALMTLAGVAWGVYSLRGRSSSNPLHTTAGNFLRAAPLAAGLCAVALAIRGSMTLDTAGIAYAAASGVLASGLGYAIWFAALRGLRSTEAAVVQLSVPVIAMVGGIVLLQEAPTLRGCTSAFAVLGGISSVILGGTDDRHPASGDSRRG